MVTITLQLDDGWPSITKEETIAAMATVDERQHLSFTTLDSNKDGAHDIIAMVQHLQ